jgi:hypothetical protein
VSGDVGRARRRAQHRRERDRHEFHIDPDHTNRSPGRLPVRLPALGSRVARTRVAADRGGDDGEGRRRPARAMGLSSKPGDSPRREPTNMRGKDRRRDPRAEVEQRSGATRRLGRPAVCGVAVDDVAGRS